MGLTVTPVEICGALLASIVPADAVPELRDEDVRQEVTVRLSEVGCELVYSHHFDCWTTRLAGPLPNASLSDSPHALDAKDLAVLAACWLHLRFLPMENSRLPLDDGGLFPSDDVPAEVPLDQADLASQIQTLHPSAIQIALGKLKRARFLVQRNGQLFAGPMLDALDEVRATEQARRLLLRHQRLARLRRPAADRGDQLAESMTTSDVDDGVTDATD
jgi:hypothetical protein